MGASQKWLARVGKFTQPRGSKIQNHSKEPGKSSEKYLPGSTVLPSIGTFS